MLIKLRNRRVVELEDREVKTIGNGFLHYNTFLKEVVEKLNQNYSKVV